MPLARARGVQQDGVEGPAVPPARSARRRRPPAAWPPSRRRCRVSCTRARRAGSLSSASRSRSPQLQQVRGLAARGGAGVQHARAGRAAAAGHSAVRAAATRRAARRRPAPRPQPSAKPGSAVHRAGLGPAPPAWPPRRGRPAAVGRAARPCGQALHVGRAGAAAGVHAQGHGRAAAPGACSAAATGSGQSLAQPLHPPQRGGSQRASGLAGDLRRHGRLAFAQEAAQHGVDEAGGAGARARAARTAWSTSVWSGYGGLGAPGHSSATPATSSALHAAAAARVGRHGVARSAWRAAQPAQRRGRPAPAPPGAPGGSAPATSVSERPCAHGRPRRRRWLQQPDRAGEGVHWICTRAV
jgi:hypothetical protein